MEQEPHSRPIRFYEIDLLRFIAAFSVVLFHLTFRGYAADNFSPVPFPGLAQFTRYGYLGVPLFFIISGYVILRSAQGKTLRRFFLSRVTRLYPAFWAACTLTFIVGRLWGPGPADTQMNPVLHPGLWTYAYNMTMLQAFFGIPDIDGVYWSLTVEIKFYFLISLLLGYRLMRHLDVFIAGLLLFTLLPGIPPSGTPFSYLFFAEYIPYFAAGMLFYLLQQPGGFSWLRCILLIASCALSVRGAVIYIGNVSAYYNQYFSPAVVACTILLFFIVFLLIILRVINLDKAKWLAVPGALTYPLYLIHSNITFIAYHRIGHLFNKYVLLGVSILLMLALSYLIHILIEKRMSKPLGAVLNRWMNKAG